MKIAFTSCIDALDDPTQMVWDRISEQNPDVLLLLGDTVYMDFGLLSDRRLGWPRKATNEVFASTLYSRYLKQWGVASFRKLLAAKLPLGMIWDDHDFAWNNSRGAGVEKRYQVSREKRLISHGLFLQFRQVLVNQLQIYPPMPSIAELLATDDVGIQISFDLDPVRFIMLDGRSFREDPNDVPDAEMHGRVQRAWFAELMQSWDGPKVIGAGSVLSRSGDSWDKYIDYTWLLKQPSKQIIVLTGDIHKNVAPVRHSPAVYEITSSGAARPGLGGGSGNFGVLTIQDEMFVTLYSQDVPNGSRFPLLF